MGIDNLLPSAHRQAVEIKKQKIAFWLSLFQYSTRSLLVDYLGNKDKCVLRRLINNQFLQLIDTDMISEKIVLLGRVGAVYAKENFDIAASLNNRPSSINQTLIRHELSLQKYLISEFSNIENIRPTRFLDFADKRKLPDALVSLSSSTNEHRAVEIERVHKSRNRIFQAFFNHAYFIAKLRHYDSVIYVFPNENLRKIYLDLFNLETWPKFRFDTQAKRYVRDSEDFICPESLKSRFSFTVMEMI